MRSSFDFSPYRRSTVGFDRLFDFLESAGRAEPADNYPPYDIEKLNDDSYRDHLWRWPASARATSTSPPARTCWW